MIYNLIRLIRSWFFCGPKCGDPYEMLRMEYLSLVHDHAGLIDEARRIFDLGVQQRTELTELRAKVSALEMLRIQAAINLDVVAKKLQESNADCARLCDAVETLQSQDYKPGPPNKTTIAKCKCPDYLPRDL